MVWMIEEANRSRDKNIASKAVVEFPELFRGLQKANLQKASRWWKTRDSFKQSLNCKGGTQRQSVSCKQTWGSRKVVLVKACIGRGRKRVPWVEWLHLQLLEEFRRLSKANVKFSPTLLLALAKDLLKSASDDAPYTEQSVCNGENSYDKVTSGFSVSRSDLTLFCATKLESRQ
jgi:hypothetical protein